MAGNFIKCQTASLSTHILGKPLTPDVTTTYTRRHILVHHVNTAVIVSFHKARTTFKYCCI